MQHFGFIKNILYFIICPQLLNQVLNRVTAERNLFDRVVSLRLPGNFNQFPSYVRNNNAPTLMQIEALNLNCMH